MFLSVVILGRFTTETHAMALHIRTDTPPLLTPRQGTPPGVRDDDLTGDLTLSLSIDEAEALSKQLADVAAKARKGEFSSIGDAVLHFSQSKS